MALAVLIFGEGFDSGIVRGCFRLEFEPVKYVLVTGRLETGRHLP